MTRYILAVILFLPLLTMAQTTLLNNLLNKNLLKNPGAESGEPDVPGWELGEVKLQNGAERTGTIDSSSYGHTSGEFDDEQGKSRGFGNFYFRLSGDHRDAVLASKPQVISLAAARREIDAQEVGYKLSGYFGTSDEDYSVARLVAVFRDAAGKELATVQTDEYFAKLHEHGEFKPQEKMGLVPVGTARVEVFLRAYGTQSKGNAENSAWLAFADNLNFSLHNAKTSAGVPKK
jgi:hypothetical protein